MNKPFRHLTPRSRKRVMRALLRKFFDLHNERDFLLSERDYCVGIGDYAEAAELRDMQLHVESRITELEPYL